MEHFPSDYTDYFLIFKKNLQISLPQRGCVGQHRPQELCFVLLVTTELIISSFPALMACDGHSASRSCQLRHPPASVATVAQYGHQELRRYVASRYGHQNSVPRLWMRQS